MNLESGQLVRIGNCGLYELGLRKIVQAEVMQQVGGVRREGLEREHAAGRTGQPSKRERIKSGVGPDVKAHHSLPNETGELSLNLRLVVTEPATVGRGSDVPA